MPSLKSEQKSDHQAPSIHLPLRDDAPIQRTLLPLIRHILQLMQTDPPQEKTRTSVARRGRPHPFLVMTPGVRVTEVGAHLKAILGLCHLVALQGPH